MCFPSCVINNYTEETLIPRNQSIILPPSQPTSVRLKNKTLPIIIIEEIGGCIPEKTII